MPGRPSYLQAPSVRDRLLRDAYLILAVVFVGLRLFAVEPWADSVDAYAYWTTRDGVFYDSTTGRIGAYLYSPAFAQAVAPLVWLPLAVFTALWTALNCAALWWLLGRWALPSLLFLPIPFEIISGNVHLLYAVAIVAGFRYAPAWALLLLTKVTPAIGLTWFLVRREWRALAAVAAVTGAIVAVSVVLDTAAWREWMALLQGDLADVGGSSLETLGWYLPVPLLPRIVAAAATAAFAGLTDRRWLLPIAVTLALPVVWLNGLAVLAASVPLWRERAGASAVAPAAPVGAAA
jgi:hypothetical protein